MDFSVFLYFHGVWLDSWVAGSNPKKKKSFFFFFFFWGSKSWFQQQLRRWLWRAGAPVWGGGGYRFVKSERVVVLCCWWVLIELKVLYFEFTENKLFYWRGGLGLAGIKYTFYARFWPNLVCNKRVGVYFNTTDVRNLYGYLTCIYQLC